MSSENGERRGVTYKTMFGISSAVLGSAAMVLWLVMSDRVKTAEGAIDDLQKAKVDKMDFIRAMDKIDEQYKTVINKIDEHDRNSARRSNRGGN